MPVIRFNYADIPCIMLKNKSIVKKQIGELFSNEGKELKHLDFIFCSDIYLLEINKSFLKHNFYTDVITFDLSEGTGTIGEVYISVDRVRENAIIYSSTFANEVLRVIFHGVLHLCGYKDKKKSEITVIREKEDYYLRLLQEKI